MPAHILFLTRHCLLKLVLLGLVGVTASAQTTALFFKPVAFGYSKKLSRLVLISSNPNRLHIYDPVTAQTLSVPLVQPPLSLSIDPSGTHAAVGHDALVSYVDLEKATVQKQFTVPTVVSGVIAASSWIYTVGEYYTSPYSINIESGQATKNTTAGSSMTGAKLNVGVNAIYGTRDNTSPNDVEKFDISTGPLTRKSDSPYHGDYCVNGPVWLSPDWTRIYTGCGTVFRASTDPQRDMFYISSIPNVNSIGSLDESDVLQKIALLRRKPAYGVNTIDEAIVHVFESAYLLPSAQFTLAGFEAGGKTYGPHGRAVFFSADSTELIVVKQADSSSGILNDYAIERIPLTPKAPCGAVFATSSVDVPAQETTSSVGISAPGGCVYEATSLAPWITIVFGGMGYGNGTLQWSVSANPDTVPRTGTIILPGQILTIRQESASSTAAPIFVPGYYAVDAAYAKPTDRLVLVSANPNRLHIVDPNSRTDTVVPLNAPPLSLSVRPDGAQAAVGHDGWVTLVDLNAASVQKVIAVPTDVHSLILASNGYAYLFPLQEWGDLFSLGLDTERIERTGAIYKGREPRLHVDGKSIYVGGNYQSKWDISGGVAKLVNSWPSSGGCGKPWLTEDGRRLFGDCAKAYITSEVPAQDYQYNGSLSNASRLVWLDESVKAAVTAAIPLGGSSYGTNAKASDDTQVQLYLDAYLAYLGAIPLPKFIVGGSEFPAHGRYVFWNSSGTSLYVIVQADSKALLTGGTGIVQLRVADAKQVTVNSVVNAASQAPLRIAPGEVITIYGAGMGPKTGVGATVNPTTNKIETSLSGTEVFINAMPLPVLFASDTQVNAIVPFGAYSLSGPLPLQVSTAGVLSPAFTVTMAGSVPGVFTMDGSGSGQAVAVNLDGTVCDSAHPAVPGSYVIVYFTGGGFTSPPGITGGVAGSTLKRLSETAQATVADIPATVSFAGAAPGMVEGVNQLNIKLANNTPSGPAQVLIVTVGNNSSPPTATIAVK